MKYDSSIPLIELTDLPNAKLNTARNNKALTELVEKHNVDLRKLPDNVLIELKKITDEVMQDFIKDDPMAQRVYKSYTEFKEQVINYHRISEKAYIDTRELD